MKKKLTIEQRIKKAAYDKQYQQDHKAEIAIRQKRYREGHKVKLAAYDEQYYQDNKDKIGMRSKQYRRDRRAEVAAYKKQYQQDHKAEIAIRKRRYYQENKDKVIKYQQDHRTEIATCEKRRRANNIGCRLKINIRNGVRQSIKGTKQYKHSIDLLGCTIPEVRNHLERQFKPGMSWDNWGTHGWHIDHIIPLDYFNFADPEQQKRAWHYTNLQPLWATDNLKKHNKVEERQLVLL